MSERPAPREFRDSVGVTALRRKASECEAKADQLTREASMMRSAAFDYRRRADAVERENHGRAWSDLRPGDTITLRVFDHQEGLKRERRYVVAVDWPVITFRDGDREYDFDCSQGEQVDRDVRLVVAG
jgi:hypothetical protein